MLEARIDDEHTIPRDEDLNDIRITVACQIVGWKWVSYLGLPMTSHPQYREARKGKQFEIRIRRLLSPFQVADRDWQKHLTDNDVRDSDGTEPLDYCYCSSGGYAWPDHKIAGQAEDILREHELFDDFLHVLTLVPRTEQEKRDPHLVSERVRLLAALSVWQQSTSPEQFD